MIVQTESGPVMVTKKKLSRVLRGAANHLEEFGWQTGTYGSVGRPCCAAGAIKALTVATPVEVLERYAVDYPETYMLEDLSVRRACSLGFNSAEAQVMFVASIKAVAHKIGAQGLAGIFDWNDSPLRSGKEVIRTLRTLAREFEHGRPLPNISPSDGRCPVEWS